MIKNVNLLLECKKKLFIIYSIIKKYKWIDEL